MQWSSPRLLCDSNSGVEPFSVVLIVAKIMACLGYSSSATLIWFLKSHFYHYSNICLRVVGLNCDFSPIF